MIDEDDMRPRALDFDDEALAAVTSPRGKPKKKFKSFDVADLHGEPVPEREWHVQDLIPQSQVTLFSGDGGLGKTQLMLQLACSTVLGRPWLGRDVRKGRALVVTAEDSREELHRRLVDIARAQDVELFAYRGLVITPLAGEDQILAKTEGPGIVKATELFLNIDKFLSGWRAELVVFDPLADLFVGDENNRIQARQFISLLRGLAIRHQTSVVLTAHPSLTGINSGTGTSGSTAWNASVRSRLYLETAKREKDGEPDHDARVLRSKKSNYGPRGIEVALRWRRGVFVLDDAEERRDEAKSAAETAAQTKSENLFLDLLAAYDADGRHVSATPSANYAPSIFSKDQRSGGVTKHGLAEAMNRLFESKQIKVVEFGPPTRRLKRIARCEPETQP